MKRPKLAFSWLSTGAVVVAGGIVPVFALSALLIQRDPSWVLVGLPFFLSAFCAVGVAYVGAPSRGALSAAATLAIGGMVATLALLASGSPKQYEVVAYACGWAGGAFSLALCVCRERRIAGRSHVDERSVVEVVEV